MGLRTRKTLARPSCSRCLLQLYQYLSQADTFGWRGALSGTAGAAKCTVCPFVSSSLRQVSCACSAPTQPPARVLEQSRGSLRCGHSSAPSFPSTSTRQMARTRSKCECRGCLLLCPCPPATCTPSTSLTRGGSDISVFNLCNCTLPFVSHSASFTGLSSMHLLSRQPSGQQGSEAACRSSLTNARRQTNDHS